VEDLVFVLWIKPTRNHLDGLAVGGSKGQQQHAEER
jgi:hypothetical protein